MGKTRYIGKNIELSFEETKFVCDLYLDPKKTIRGLSKEQLRVALDLILKSTNYSSIGGRVKLGDSEFDRPSIWIEKENTSRLITFLTSEIGIIEGTLSFWEPRNWQIKAIACQGNLSKLENLNLGNCDNDDLRELLGKVPALKRLRLKITCIDVDLFVKFISLCPELEVLCVNSFNHKNNLLVNILKNAPHLKVLKTSHFYFTEDDFNALKEKVEKGLIHTLHFCKSFMPHDRCWVELMKAGQNSLQNLVLNSGFCNCSLNQEILLALIECKNLRRLHINASLQELITDNIFSQLLQNNPNLEEINIYWLSNLTDAALTSLYTYGKNLKRISLRQPKFTEYGIEEFIREFWSRPHAEFISLIGKEVNKGCYYVRKGLELQSEMTDSHQIYWDVEKKYEK